MEQADNKHLKYCICEDCLPERHKDCTCEKCLPDKPLVNHKSDCAIHNNPDCAGFASSVSDCDCDAIIPCAEDELIKDMTTKELIES